MKQTCPRCKTIVEINEREYEPGSKVKRQCPLCDEILEFSIPASTAAADADAIASQIAALQQQLNELQARNEKEKAAITKASEEAEKTAANEKEVKKTTKKVTTTTSPRTKKQTTQPTQPAKQGAQSTSASSTKPTRPRQASAKPKSPSTTTQPSPTRQQPVRPSSNKKKVWPWILAVLAILLIAVIMHRITKHQDVQELEPGITPNNIEINIDDDVSFKMIHIETENTEFPIGNNDNVREKPAHRVTLSDYYIGETEVTQALWFAVMDPSGSMADMGVEVAGCGSNYPMYGVSYDDALRFISRLNKLTGRTFRLPTESEWETAARSGADIPLYQKAWYIDNSDTTTHPVKQKKPNPLGLYDMVGNVSEWCSDWYGPYISGLHENPQGPSWGNHRVVRGGSWLTNGLRCNETYRFDLDPYGRQNYVGFRLVMEP